MQVLYKINENGSLISYDNKKCIISDGKVYTNPSSEMQYELGYRPLGQADMPIYDEQTEFLKVKSYYYNEDGTEILPIYEICKWEEMASSTQTIEERLLNLERAGLERDAALIELAAMITGGDI